MLAPTHPTTSRLRRLALALVFLSLSAAASAQIIVSGTINQVAGQGTLNITSPITFEVTSTGLLYGIVFDNWVTSDGTTTTVALDSGLSYRINGGSVQTLAGTNTFYDNGNSNGDLTVNDGFIVFATTSVTAGDTFSLLSGSYITTGNGSFNTQAIQTFTGDLFLLSNNNTALSGHVSAVPEPSTYAALAGLAALGLTMAVRRCCKVAV